MALGFLLAEGVIDTPDPLAGIRALTPDSTTRSNLVEADLINWKFEAKDLQRNFFAASSYGIAEGHPRGSSLVTLPEILLKGVDLAGDRRKTRYSRLRKALKNGLVDADELKVQRQSKTEAVDPELSDVMKARMGARKSMRSRD